MKMQASQASCTRSRASRSAQDLRKVHECARTVLSTASEQAQGSSMVFGLSTSSTTAWAQGTSDECTVTSDRC